jgi:tricorn protease
MHRYVHRGLALAAILVTHTATADPGYYRFPTVNADTVVFTAEDDLWSVPLTGGKATRLTTHLAGESHAAFSPDGQRIAFTASYTGVAEAWVMPAGGGQPVQVSTEGQRAQVLGWTPRGEVLYTIQAMPGPFWSRVTVAVHPDTRARRVLPLYGANEVSIGNDGTVIFTKGGLHLTTDNARGYRGGLMAKLWRWRPNQDEAAPLFTDLEANAREPMVAGDRVYFVSDQDGWDNLWSAKLDGSDRRQHTRHTGFGVRGPALSTGRIVYQSGADLRVLSLADGADRVLDIDLVSDFDQRRTRWHKQPTRFLTDTSISKDAERVAVVARGRLAIAGVGALRRMDVNMPDDARVYATAVAPDGRSVYLITDISGQQEIWRFPTDGSGPGTQLTRDGSAYRWNLHVSPDGNWVAHHDEQGRLFLLDTRSNTNTLADERPGAFHADIRWSPDSRTLAFARSATKRQIQQLVLLDVASRNATVLTSDKYNSGAPAFTPDGKWLYFLSDRNFEAWPTAPWGDRNMGPGFDRRTKVYALALQAGNRFPFLARDELQFPRPNGDKPADKPKDDKPATPAIQYAGLADRLYEVPLAAADYDALAVDGARLYLQEREPRQNARPVLRTLAIDAQNPQPELFMADVQNFTLSADGKKLLIIKATDAGPGELLVVDAGAKAPGDLSKSQVRLRDWQLELDPRAEWRQMFADAWRMHPQFIFDAKLRGNDWPAVRARFEPLVERITERGELDDLLGQMMAEMGALHSQIRPGELRTATDGAQFASLGADLEKVGDGWRIARIHVTETELPGERGPLAAPGVDAREGDVITAINGVPTTTREPYAALLNQAGQQVLLSLKRGSQTVQTVVVPVDGVRRAALAETHWERANQARVAQATDGEVGYLRLRAMTPNDINSFVREFYAQVDRGGLIIDVRANRGGNIDSWIIEKLLRRAWMFWQQPGGEPFWNMQQTFRGHLVVLANEHTYSDGETFAMGIKSLGLGTVVGTRTAGAGVWLSDRNRLRDGGQARAAESPQYDREGNWLIEGRGVDPDIEVVNLPVATARGQDAQLDAAIAHLKQRLAVDPVTQPVPKPIGPRGVIGVEPVPAPGR